MTAHTAHVSERPVLALAAVEVLNYMYLCIAVYAINGCLPVCSGLQMCSTALSCQPFTNISSLCVRKSLLGTSNKGSRTTVLRLRDTLDSRVESTDISYLRV